MTDTDDKLPKPSGRHRGAPALIGDDYAPQEERPEVHAGRMPALQAS